MAFRIEEMTPVKYNNTPVESGGVFQYQQIDAVYYVSIEADTFDDIPASPGNIETDTVHGSLVFAIGSDAHTIDTNKKYKLMSDGTWVEQVSTDVAALVTLISQLQSELVSLSSLVNGSMLGALKKAIDVGGRNMLLMNSTDGTSAGVTYARTTEGYVNTSGTSNGASLWTVSTITLNEGMELWLNGCPSGGDYYNGYSLFIAKNVSGASTLAHEEGSGIQFTVPETAEYRIRIVARNGTNMEGLRFLPQLLPIEFANTTFGDYYTPPAPSNADLYSMIL